MLIKGLKYYQHGGRVKIDHNLAVRTDAYQYSKEDGCFTVQPGFSFGEEIGTFLEKLPNGFLSFYLDGGKRCMVNGGNFEPAETVTDIMQEIYDREINFRLSTFWDGGYVTELGDEMNGFTFKDEFYDTPLEAMVALREECMVKLAKKNKKTRPTKTPQR